MGPISACWLGKVDIIPEQLDVSEPVVDASLPGCSQNIVPDEVVREIEPPFFSKNRSKDSGLWTTFKILLMQLIG